MHITLGKTDDENIYAASKLFDVFVTLSLIFESL